MSGMTNTGPPLRRPRRIVTGHNEKGESIFVSDGLAPNLLQPGDAPNLGLFNLWVVPSFPADYSGNTDTAGADEKITLSPPTGGAVFRIVELPPDSQRRWDKQREVFKAYGNPEALAHDKSRHPGFHKTESIDFAVVLEGEVWALMDVGEALMRSGDTLIQRGTNHAWSNRTNTPVRIAFILLSSLPT
jgi:hypothetical protein